MSTEITRTSLSGPWSAEPTQSMRPSAKPVERQAFATGTRVFCRSCRATGYAGGEYEGDVCPHCGGKGCRVLVRPLGRAIRGGRR